VLSIDHCFAIKGQGTVVTGTVLSGAVGVGDALVVGSGAGKRIKSIQVGGCGSGCGTVG
jgi:selenocysteine-specific elongation factor